MYLRRYFVRSPVTMFAFMVLILLEAEAAVLPTNSSDVPVYASVVISNHLNGYTEGSQDNPQVDLTARREEVRRESFVKRTSNGQKIIHDEHGREARGWRSPKPGHVIPTNNRSDETHYSTPVSAGDVGFFTELEYLYMTSYERRRPRQVQSYQSYKQMSNQVNRNDYKEISQDSLHRNGGGDARRTVKDEEIESDTSGREYLAAECSGCGESRRDMLKTTPVVYHRSSPVVVATTAFVNRIKSEAQSTAQVSNSRNQEISDFKVYFGDVYERHTTTADDIQDEKPNQDDGNIYFEPIKQKTTTPSDRENMSSRRSEYNSVSSSTPVTETVTVSNRFSFDVNIKCRPDNVKISGRCVPTS